MLVRTASCGLVTDPVKRASISTESIRLTARQSASSTSRIAGVVARGWPVVSRTQLTVVERQSHRPPRRSPTRVSCNSEVPSPSDTVAPSPASGNVGSGIPLNRAVSESRTGARR